MGRLRISWKEGMGGKMLLAQNREVEMLRGSACLAEPPPRPATPSLPFLLSLRPLGLFGIRSCLVSPVALALAPKGETPPALFPG